MTHPTGSEPSTRSELAPPRVTSKPMQRTGYAVLAASGLALATAFGSIAALASESDSTSANQRAAAHGSGASGGDQGSTGSAQRSRTIDGVAIAEEVSGSATTRPTPYTSVTIGPDGKPTTTTITPDAPAGGNGNGGDTGGDSRSDDGGGTGGGGDGGTGDGGDSDGDGGNNGGGDGNNGGGDGNGGPSTGPSDPTSEPPTEPTEPTTTNPTSTTEPTTEPTSSGSGGGSTSQ